MQEAPAAFQSDGLFFKKGKLLGFGLWTDGIPIKFDRLESLEMLSLSISRLDERSTIRCQSRPLTKQFS